MSKDQSALRIAIVGSGPAALMAGSQCVLKGYSVSFYEKKKTAGRKFLVAGQGGFNVSNAVELETFISRYDAVQVQQMIRQFTPNNLVDWLRAIGIPTYVGSSGKIFPQQGIKPIEVLNAWMNWLIAHGAIFNFEHELLDFEDGRILMKSNTAEEWLNFDRIILALGGASWKVTGSDASWVALFQSKGIDFKEFVSSNAGMNISFRNKLSEIEGTPIKNVLIKHGSLSKLGEITLTNYGLEGSPIYYLNPSYRTNNQLPLQVDFKPNTTIKKIVEILQISKTNSEGLKVLKLSKGAIWILKSELSKAEFLNVEILAERIKNLEIKIDSLRPIDEAISSAGGVCWSALNGSLKLKKFPSISLCGEMLDWDAPTGGYLLQGCFATGFVVGNEIA
ncbi:MAG: TIGR03862 family flavoprotein [Crocinitomicaceae bacterium]|nr:TIGR03862 family flavoprotein [Crocinitomicaceae bacterium]